MRGPAHLGDPLLSLFTEDRGRFAVNTINMLALVLAAAAAFLVVADLVCRVRRVAEAAFEWVALRFPMI